MQTAAVSGKASLLSKRIINLLRSPAQEWAVIAKEDGDMTGLLKSYVLPVVIAPALIALVLAMLFHGGGRLPIASVFFGFCLGIVMNVLSVYALAYLLNWLVPRYFNGEAALPAAFKLAAYSMTAAWLVKAVLFLPAIGGLLSLLGLYSFYLLYIGMPIVIKIPRDKVIPCMVVSIVVLMLFVSLGNGLLLH